MRFGPVRHPFAWQHWDKVRGLLEVSAKRGGDVTIEQIENALENEQAQLWATEDGNFTGLTQLVNVNDGKQCFIWQMAGEGDWLPYLDEIQDYARENGCSSIEGNMRPGFERILTDWKKVAVVLRRDIR